MKFKDYEEVFTPSHPVILHDFFVGREQELSDLSRGLRRPGEVPVIVGSRGVGKTSLVIQCLRNISKNVIRITCFDGMSFDNISKSLLKEIGISTSTSEYSKETKLGAEGSLKIFSSKIGSIGERKITETEKGFAKKILKPWDLFCILRDIKEKIFFVIDEYDRISPEDKIVHTNVADFLKCIADHFDELDSRFIIVGISETAVALLGEHRSIERSAKEIYLRPLRREDIHYFLTEAEENLKFKFHSLVKTRIINFSMGYPYYVHLIGVNSIDAMKDRIGEKIKNEKHRVITEEDFINGIKASVRRVFNSNLSKYKNDMKELTEKEILIIKELCVLDDRTSIKRELLRKNIVIKNKITAIEFDSILLNMQQTKKIIYVSRNSDTVRFTDPLLAPFLRTWYYKSEMIPYSIKVDANQFNIFDNK
ncbi:MAG: AAA family ATPase [Ignavibacteria bacterium]|nr:AAA family ATPase [Ignavibacteria bacterium]